MKTILKITSLILAVILMSIMTDFRSARAAPIIELTKPNPAEGLSPSEVEAEWANFDTEITIRVRDSDSNEEDAVIETVVARVSSEETEEELFLSLEETGADTGIFVGTFIVSEDTTTPSSQGSPVPASASPRPAIEADDEDELTVVFVAVSSVSIENRPPNISNLFPGSDAVVSSRNVDFTVDATDRDSGIPDPDPDEDGYLAVFFLVSAVLCKDSDIFEAGGAPKALSSILAADCNDDGNPDINLILPEDRDFDEIRDGFRVETTIPLDPGSNFVAVAAFDKAGNFTVSDEGDTVSQRPSDQTTTAVSTPTPTATPLPTPTPAPTQTPLPTATATPTAGPADSPQVGGYTPAPFVAILAVLAGLSLIIGGRLLLRKRSATQE